MRGIVGRKARVAFVVAAIGAVATVAAAQQQEVTHLVPFFPAASDTQPQGFLRIVNNSGETGSVSIVAFDDGGNQSDELTLALGANETVGLDAEGLEAGAPDDGLTGSTGRGEGDWRLRLSSNVDIEPQAFARTPDGALWEMHETARASAGGYRIATFNPGSNVNQVSHLRLVNSGDEAARVTVSGTDDSGTSPGPGVRLEIAPGEAATFPATELESGVAPGLEGSLGDGAGKWRLDIGSSVTIRVMSLLSSPTGHLTNLSTIPAPESGGVHRVPLFPPASDPYGRQGFARVANRSEVAGDVVIEAFDDTTWRYDPLTLSIGANETVHFNSNDLELGNAGKALTGSTGAGAGDWRLELTSDLDIEVLSYVRTVGGLGYVTPMHDTAAQESEGLMRYYVPVFHAAGYDGQESRLHLVNLGAEDAQVGVSGLDDAGQPPPQGDVSLVIAGGDTRVLTARQLEEGDVGLDGRFGTGSGSWRLFVSTEGDLQVMSLGYGLGGFLANLSRGRPVSTVVSRPEVPVHPDLVVEAPSVSDSAPDAGAEFRLSATVTNQGDSDADSTIVRFYVSVNAHISATDSQVGSDRVGALSVGESSGESILLNAPSDGGVYYYGACVDEVAGESDVSNNCSQAVAVTVTQPRPDLFVQPPTVSKTSPGAGDEFTLSVTVGNGGNGDADATTLHYYRSMDPTISSADTPVGTGAVAALAVQDSSSESIALNAPSDPGTYYYGACVDAVADESDTANNCSSAVLVTVPDANSDAPDLVVESPSVNEDQLAPGATFELSAAVRNVGSGGAEATTLRFYQSTDAIISMSDTEVGTESVGALGASESSSRSVAVTAPSTLGTYHYGACVDAVADESDTANNCSVPVQVAVEGPAFPDLVVGAPTVSNSTPGAGEEFTLAATVRNQGDAEASRTVMSFFSSTDDTISPSDFSLGFNLVPSIPQSGTISQSIMVRAREIAGTTEYYGACVEPVPDESDTTNNCSPSVAVTVPLPTGGPDLVIGLTGQSTLGGGLDVPGTSYEWHASAVNVGDEDSEATTMRFYRWTSTESFDPEDSQVGTAAVPVLGYGDTSDGQIELTFPLGTATYYHRVCVDTVADELDTTNNCSESRGTVGQTPGPILRN